MDKKDFRVQFPLWNISLFLILILWTYGVVYAVDLINNDFEDLLVVAEDGVKLNWHIPGLLSIIIGFILIVVFFIAYFTRLNRHKKKYPNHKINAFTFFKPVEFLEDDEMLSQVTRNATKKVYIFYSQALPLIIFLFVIFPFERFVYIVLLLLLLIVHNTLYYLEIRKFLSGNYNLSMEKKTSNNRYQKMLTIFVIAVPFFHINQIINNHNESSNEFEACIKVGKTATMEFNKDGFTSVKCQ